MCEGPMIWFETEDGAILECPCGYVVTTGNFNDDAHAETPVLREGLAS